MRIQHLIFEDQEIAVRYAADDRPWFDALTLCNLLGYADWQSALLQHCHPAGIMFGEDDTPQALISCDCLQRLSLHAPSPRAARVRDWLSTLKQPP